MTEQGALISTEPRTGRPLEVVARATLVSGALGAVGIVFLVLMFVSFGLGARSAGMVFGWINDVLVMLSYLLAAPAALALRTLLRSRAPVLGTLVALVGLGSIGAIVILQLLLVVGALTFEAQIGPASIAFVGLAVWFLLTGLLGRSSGVLPHGLRDGLLAATYIGYPVWAYSVGRRFLRLADLPEHRRSTITREG